MRTLASRFVAGALLALLGLGAAPDSQHLVVGQIIIVGNEHTPSQVILRQIPLHPGQQLTYPPLRIAEQNLARLNIFEVSPDEGVRPTLTLLDDPNNPNNPVKDILVTVQEGNTGSLMFGLGVNFDSGLTGSVVLNERNSDTHEGSPPTRRGGLLVSDVIIRGNRVVPTEALRACLSLRLGVAFSPKALLADLAALNRFPRVEDVQASQTSDGNGGARVVFQVRDYPGLVGDVAYRNGDSGSTSIPREELERIATAAGVRKGAILNPAANRAACRGIVAAYADWGRPLARCTWSKCGKRNSLQVTFDIKEGGVVQLDRIRVTGNTFAGPEVLKNLISTAAPALVVFDIQKNQRPTFNLAAVDAAAEELVKYHRAFGFRHVSVDRQLSFADNKTVLEFRIHEGKRSRVKPGAAVPVPPCPPRGPQATPVPFEVSRPVRPRNPDRPPAP
jgi:outer membrane protein assembly factor BamA